MTDIVENEDVDKDTIDAATIEQQFSKKYEMISETSVSQKKAYINKICGTESMRFAIILPDNSIEVYEFNGGSLCRTCRFTGHEKKVTEVVFDPKDDNMLFSCAEDGLIKLWDTRAGGTFVHDYKDEAEEIVRPYESMDVSNNGRVICAGSQVVEDDAYLVFWDQRAPKPLGGYWNSHTEDVTQVKFHKEKMEVLATGSIDGLLNVFDITQQTEEDALTYTVSMGTALDKISWLNSELAACATQSNDLHVWNLAKGDLVNTYKRDKIARGIKRSRADDCYVVDAYMSTEGWPVLLAGSYGGCEDALRAVGLRGRALRPRTDFAQNKQIVRTCHYDRARDLLLTAGERGVVNVWRGLPLDEDSEPEMETPSPSPEPPPEPVPMEAGRSANGRSAEEDNSQSEGSTMNSELNVADSSTSSDSESTSDLLSEREVDEEAEEMADESEDEDDEEGEEEEQHKDEAPGKNTHDKLRVARHKPY